MNNTIARMGAIDLEAVSREVAGSLARVGVTSAGAYISTPLLYPSGTTVVVQILRAPQGFLVSDMGSGLDESRSMGAEAIYRRAAKDVAAQTGALFNEDRGRVEVNVSKEQLVGAAASIANCSQEAVRVTAFKLEERKAARASDKMYRRLWNIVKDDPQGQLDRNVEIRGESKTGHRFDSLAIFHGKTSVFDFVSPHPLSVASAATKFADVKRRGESTPLRRAVVHSKSAMGTRLGLLVPVCEVIEEDIPEPFLIRLLEAA